ncbi:pantoate--beta-alanine ligase [Sanyastnella coralliicola]|uniref:pantoate--beta-alanine ligase n=1 Tax=Sanyastnella coralliicola TaxID=3069118 RepID=UPI0027B8FB0B|nr:pantoate--beta-alanine ligase [Longitalea sp. SCSIO 12813]
MILFTHPDEWKALRSKVFTSAGSVGYVPTMGALHAGHGSLIERAAKENEICVCSIFVNPTQFDRSNDLEAYPRTLSADIELAKRYGCDAIFAPGVNDIYGDKVESLRADYGFLTETLEGAERPGHFDGVVTIVRLLLDAIQADKAYFGEKDFQQLAIIRELVRREQIPTEIMPCTLIRDTDGLAMSSRNVRLSPQGRQNALAIYRTLKEMAERATKVDPQMVQHWGQRHLEQQPGVELEYLSVVYADDFQEASDWSREVRALVAAWVDGVRLIDNMALN